VITGEALGRDRRHRAGVSIVASDETTPASAQITIDGVELAVPQPAD
jgi:hypothetical protein